MANRAALATLPFTSYPLDVEHKFIRVPPQLRREIISKFRGKFGANSGDTIFISAMPVHF
jgi:hypothetical protein